MQRISKDLNYGTLPLLFIGESGTGKTHSAQAVHCRSMMKQGPFMPLNCAGISETLAESTLFGCVEGAFTGAKTHRGYFSEANNGTIFLDEVGELSLTTQAKLLQVLSEGIFMRLGSTSICKSHARVICATNIDLKIAVEKGRFREDLYHRISVMPIHLKPLRERRHEIPGLVMDYLHSRKKSVDVHAMRFLVSEEWLGNIRQLFSCLEIACYLSEKDVLDKETVQYAYRISC
ncbi:MAG: sigma 54-interacting transcriptional regulator [Treponemataceae bacterium]|nr:sigma 54-interacting transcriptional regulator [Treponemataceae bacterium]